MSRERKRAINIAAFDESQQRAIEYLHDVIGDLEQTIQKLEKRIQTLERE